jgi:hypothetical protein
MLLDDVYHCSDGCSPFLTIVDHVFPYMLTMFFVYVVIRFVYVDHICSSATQHRRLLNIVGYQTSSTLSTIEIRRLIKEIQDY